MRLKDRVAIVTGAGTGIGKATAILFAREGASVVCANRTPETGVKTVDEIVGEGGEAVFVQTDASLSGQVHHLVETTLNRFGKVDVLFNNAGISAGGSIVDLDETVWDRVMANTLKSVYLCTRAVVPSMLQQGHGVIINNSSVLALQSLPRGSAYAAAKAGILAFTRSVALELALHNIRVNALVTGSTDTPMMWSGVAEQEMPAIAQHVSDALPIGRVAAPMEIAHAALFLASDESSYLLGTSLVVDGGLLAKIASPR